MHISFSKKKSRTRSLESSAGKNIKNCDRRQTKGRRETFGTFVCLHLFLTFNLARHSRGKKTPSAFPLFSPFPPRLSMFRQRDKVLFDSFCVCSQRRRGRKIIIIDTKARKILRCVDDDEDDDDDMCIYVNIQHIHLPD